jgi:DNA-binding transcriptional LysR family regulator
MNDKQIKGFIKTVEEGSISKAALYLFISPQALVQQINTLESEIGTTLLERSPRGVSCTPAGDYFYKNIKYVEAYLGQIVAECRRLGSQAKETLRVGVFSTPLFMPSFCFTFSRKYPSIEIRQIEVNSDNFFKLLLFDEVDVVETGPFSILEGQPVRFTKLMDMQPVCILSKDHPLARKKIIEPDDLAGQTVAVPDIHFFTRYEKYADAMGKIHFLDKVFGREAMAKICINGGIYIIPEPAALALRPFLSIPFQFETLELGLLTRLELSPTEKLFVEEAMNTYHM